ncbi:MAG TPA: hypothetical protein VI756_23205 [Blastocatellia bacterium]
MSYQVFLVEFKRGAQGAVTVYGDFQDLTQERRALLVKVETAIAEELAENTRNLERLQTRLANEDEKIRLAEEEEAPNRAQIQRLKDSRHNIDFLEKEPLDIQRIKITDRLETAKRLLTKIDAPSLGDLDAIRLSFEDRGIFEEIVANMPGEIRSSKEHEFIDKGPHWIITSLDNFFVSIANTFPRSVARLAREVRRLEDIHPSLAPFRGSHVLTLADPQSVGMVTFDMSKE